MESWFGPVVRYQTAMYWRAELAKWLGTTTRQLMESWFGPVVRYQTAKY